MGELNAPWVWIRLKHSLQALALSSDVQLSLFPDFVGKPDELALDFDNFFHVIFTNDEFVLTEQQQDSLLVIQGSLDSMTEMGDAELWTEEALFVRHGVARAAPAI